MLDSASFLNLSCGYGSKYDTVPNDLMRIKAYIHDECLDANIDLFSTKIYNMERKYQGEVDTRTAVDEKCKI